MAMLIYRRVMDSTSLNIRQQGCFAATHSLLWQTEVSGLSHPTGTRSYVEMKSGIRQSALTQWENSVTRDSPKMIKDLVSGRGSHHKSMEPPVKTP